MAYLDFEAPIAELEGKIASLRMASSGNSIDLADEIEKLEQKCQRFYEKIYADLNDWQITQVARHPDRPYTLDYARNIFDSFDELHGDRHFADDSSIICGLARLDGLPLAFVGHQKGREVKDKVQRNFGMPKPEGYRKALRVMELAERFKLPVISFIDTPGAYPGIDAEQRGQSEAIAWNLMRLATLRTPIVSLVIGEGGSGGALAIGVCDYLLMLQYATYSVISPEGCASILWRSNEKAPEAAASMHLTASKLKKLNLVDEIIAEPIGGAHRHPEQLYPEVKSILLTTLNKLSVLPADQLSTIRYQKLNSLGVSIDGK